MNQVIFEKRYILLIVLFIVSILSSSYTAYYAQSDSWQAGVARVDITPKDSLWMGGYASRDHTAEGTLHKLWSKALAVVDKNGNRGVIVTNDILGFPKDISDNIKERCKKEYQLEKPQIILSSSHTHSGPAVRNNLDLVYPLSEDHIKDIENYSIELENRIVDLIGKALENLISVQLFSDNGVARFQINRRNNNARTLSVQTDLNGPNDYAVPVLEVRKMNEELYTTLFGYACHPTVLNSYKWSGDYPGFAQLALEEKYSEATAMFFQGCGADQNPLPRRSVSLAKQYGQELAAAVERIIEDESDPISAELKTGYTEVEIFFSSPPKIETLEELAADTTLYSYQQKWVKQMLSKIKDGEQIPKSYPYPIQIWKLGSQTIIALGGEVVIDYAIKLKRIFGNDIFVMGYCNDVMGYIPTTRVLREGGYESRQAQMVYGLPSTWKADIEVRILQSVIDLAKKIGIEILEPQLFSN
ncbi:MAG: neutral/alkaline non-lysosomal ceramidase N-terminal domain-containing protein [Bacteroidota bacterium]